MFTLEENEEGFSVVHEGRAVCYVNSKAISFKDGPNLKFPEKVITPLPKEQWRIHFTGYKLTLPELVELLKVIA